MIFVLLNIQLLLPLFSLSDVSMWRRSIMRLRVRKAPQQPSPGRRSHPAKGKRKHCEVSPSPVRGRGKMQKSETGLLSTIKKFIRGNAVKVGEHLNPKFFYRPIVNVDLLLESALNTNCNILASTCTPEWSMFTITDARKYIVLLSSWLQSECFSNWLSVVVKS